MKRIFPYACAMVSVIACLMPVGAWAQDAAADVEPSDVMKKEIYWYQSSERRDPFLSIVKSSELEKKKREKTGTSVPTENYDISQMKLVAIIEDHETDASYALVGLPDKKYYQLREGMPVGLHEGVVLEIDLRKVVVREKLQDYKGNLILQDTVMRLRKEEEE